MQTLTPLDSLEPTDLIRGRWNQFELIFKVTEKSNLPILNLYENQTETILKSISHIHFPHLMTLDVYLNGIESVECLPRISLPSLKKLFINENRISTLRTLVKGSWPQLEQMRYDENFIQTSKHLFTIKATLLSQIHIEWSHHRPQEVDLRWMVKIQTGCLHTLLLVDRKTKQGNMLRTKYSSLVIKDQTNY